MPDVNGPDVDPAPELPLAAELNVADERSTAQPLDDGVDLRVALGRALQRRAAEVAAAVVASLPEERWPSGASAEQVTALISRPTALGTQLIGLYFATGAGANLAEIQELASSARTSVAENFALSDTTKCYLVWRDTTLRVAKEEGRRLGADSRLIREAITTIEMSYDASVVQMVNQFDIQRLELQERLDAEREKLAHLALHDPLTGLANRTLLLYRLTHAVISPARHARQVGVLFLDLDEFKSVNDRFGHQAGDTLLTAVADRLTQLVRPSDTVARLGGDEFVILCDELSDEDSELTALVERIRAGIGSCARSIQSDQPVSVSIGVALASSGSDPERVLAQADVAMYATKHRGAHGETP